MLERNELLRRKTREVQGQLTKWARRKKILNPGEMIEFTLSIATIPIVMPRIPHKDQLFGMTLDRFLTPGRFEAAGVEPRGNRARILDRVVNRLNEIHPEQASGTSLSGLPIKWLVSDMASEGKFMLTRGLYGLTQHSLDILQRVCNHCGITLAP